MKNQLIACAALIVLSLNAQALSLREAAQLALRNDPRIQATAASVRASEAVVDQAEAGFKPNVQFAADAGKSDLQTGARFPVSGPRTPNGTSLSFSQPLYTGGATAALAEAASSSLDATLQNQRDAGGKIILAALTAYLDVVRDRGLVELSRANARTLERAQSDVQKRLDAGEATKTDLAQASARVAEAHAGVRRALAQMRISEAAFTRVTGTRPENLSSDWPAPAVPGTLDEALKLSARAPFVLAAEANAAVSKSRIAVAGAERLPRLSFDGRAATQDNTEFGYDRLNTWSLQIKLTVPLYEGGLAQAKISESSARAEEAQFIADDARRSFAEIAAREWEMLKAADEVIHAYEAQVSAAELALDGVRKELEAGTRTTLDLLDAERELLAAQVNLVGSKRDRAVTAFKLLAACGRLEPEAIPQ